MTNYYPSREFTFVSKHPIYGHRIEFPDDSNVYGIQPSQKWLPHEIEDFDHPARVNDIVTLSNWLEERVGTGVAIVSAVRTFKSEKRSNGKRQVQLLGLPLQWFSISHFLEYQGCQIRDHIWGDFAWWAGPFVHTRS